MSAPLAKAPRIVRRSATATASRAGSTRHGRRRLVDPATCEREYLPEEVEFMQALDHYKRTSGRMFPTRSEVLAVLKSLGYQRAAACG